MHRIFLGLTTILFRRVTPTGSFLVQLQFNCMEDLLAHCRSIIEHVEKRRLKRCWHLKNKGSLYVVLRTSCWTRY